MKSSAFSPNSKTNNKRLWTWTDPSTGWGIASKYYWISSVATQYSDIQGRVGGVYKARPLADSEQRRLNFVVHYENLT